MSSASHPITIRTPIAERVAASAVFGVIAIASLIPQFLGLANVHLAVSVRLSCAGVTLICAAASAYTFRGGYIRVDDTRVTIKRNRTKRTVSRADISAVILGQGQGFEAGHVVPSLVLRTGQTLKLVDFASPRHEHVADARGSRAGKTVDALRAVLASTIDDSRSSAA
jgi:hypothetical protein